MLTNKMALNKDFRYISTWIFLDLSTSYQQNVDNFIINNQLWKSYFKETNVNNYVEKIFFKIIILNFIFLFT